MSTLYLTQQGASLRKDHGRFLIRQIDQVDTEVPIREIQRILVFGNIQLTTSAISTCLTRRIPVVFLSRSGDYKGHLWSAESRDFTTESAQFQHWNDDFFQMQVAKAIVCGKIWNSKQLLLKLNRKHKDMEVYRAIADMSHATINIEPLNQIDQLNVLRGHEGAAAARYFAGLGRLIVNEDFSLTQRSRRPPTDPVNSLLSFGYTLLFKNVLSLMLAEGLNPYLGNLHRSDRKEPHLAFDLMEEFRSPIVDTLVIQLINQKVFKPEDFQEPNEAGGVYLTDSARRVFLKHVENRFCTQTSHPDVRRQVDYRRVIQLQIQRYKQLLLEGTPYQPFRREV